MRFSRLESLIGKEKVQLLAQKKVVVFGVGGVGGYVVEALARSSVGAICVVDGDQVNLSNINRQIIALSSTVGKNKVDVIKERVLDINPDCVVDAMCQFYKGEGIDFSKYDYVVDCIDDVEAKITIMKNAQSVGVPVICSMGTANKLNPHLFKIDDLFSTKGCPLAKRVRNLASKAGVIKGSVKALFSSEESVRTPNNDNGRILGSTAFCPSVAGLLIAGEVINDLVAGE